MTYKLHLHPSVHLTFRGKYFPELSGVNLFKPTKVQHIHSWCIWPNLSVLKTSPRMKGIRLCFYPENDKMTVTDRNRELQLPSFRESVNLVAGFCLVWGPEIGNEVDNSASWLASQLADLAPRWYCILDLTRPGQVITLHQNCKNAGHKKLPSKSYKKYESSQISLKLGLLHFQRKHLQSFTFLRLLV